MRNKIDAFYSRKDCFFIFTILALAFWPIWGITNLIAEYCMIKLVVFAGIIFLLVGGLLISFITESKSVQKIMLDCLLLFFIIDYIEIAEVYISFGYLPLTIIHVLSLVLQVAAFVFHVLQQTDRTGNGIICIIDILYGLVMLQSLSCLVVSTYKGVLALTDLTFELAMIFTFSMIICMETRINKEKLLSANNIEVI